MSYGIPIRIERLTNDSASRDKYELYLNDIPIGRYCKALKLEIEAGDVAAVTLTLAATVTRADLDAVLVNLETGEGG